MVPLPKIYLLADNWIPEFSQIGKNDTFLICDSESMWALPILVEPNDTVLETVQEF